MSTVTPPQAGYRRISGVPRRIVRVRAIRSDQRGVTLIEVIVAMLVLLVGLLGMLKLQSDSLKITYASFQRTLANIQAQDLVERVWANACWVDNSNILQIESDWVNQHDPTRTHKSSLGPEKNIRMQGSNGPWDGTVTFDNSGKVHNVRIRWWDAYDNQGMSSLPPTYWHFTVIESDC